MAVPTFSQSHRSSCFQLFNSHAFPCILGYLPHQRSLRHLRPERGGVRHEQELPRGAQAVVLSIAAWYSVLTDDHRATRRT